MRSYISTATGSTGAGASTSAAAWSPGQWSLRVAHVLDVFLRGKQPDELHRYFNGTHWSLWLSLGGDFT
jgi:hypothetical protein